jgi:hypothetical protein
MLVMTGGRERTKLEFEALLDVADYKLTNRSNHCSAEHH